MTDLEPRPESGGFTTVIVASIVVGALAIGAALSGAPWAWSLPSGTGALGEGGETTARLAPEHATEEYGRRLVAHTAELLGQDHPDPDRRYINSRLNCGSCHLATGTEPGTLTLLQTAEHYPRFSARAGAQTDIEDRINECMTRSMNGKPLPMDSPEMMAIAAYLRSLGSQYDAMGASLRKTDEPPPFKTPVRAADIAMGQVVYSTRCTQCHGTDGQGLLAATDRAKGYLFPPLWGPDSFNNGAGMHRVLTAARFIKARMPLGEPTLTDDEAFDVAAFINFKPRPEMPNLEQDYPDKAAKPVDNAYGPFADDFPLEQHRFGPFQPIEEHYKALKKTAK